MKLTCSQSTSSSLNYRRFQIKSISKFNILINYQSNICKQKFNKYITRIIELTYDRENVFVISYFQSNTYNFFFIVSTNRAFFCFVSYRIFQILIKRRQKNKNFSRRIFKKFRETFCIDHAFFCFFFIEFFKF